MKKTLVALAALAATGAFAQSTVSIQGIMDANVQSGKHYGQSYSLVGQSGARTTSIRFHGTEDMGKGLKANFRFEVQPSFTAGDGNGFNNTIATAAAVSVNGAAQATGQASAQSGLVGKGYSFMGVSGGFGEVQFGTINTASLSAYLNASGAFGTGVGSGYGVVQGSTGTNTYTRFENSVVYMTPSFNGFSARFQTALGNDSQYGATTGVTLRRSGVREVGLSYAAGPLTVNVAQLEVKASSSEAAATTTAPAGSDITTKTTTASVGYNLGVARLGAGVSNISNNAGALSGSGNGSSTTGATETKSYILTATVPMGAARLMANIGQRKTDKSPITVLEGQKTTFTGLAAEYDLSKRTFVYARYQAGKAGDVSASSVVINGAAQAVGQLSNTKFNLFAVGVSHAF